MLCPPNHRTACTHTRALTRMPFLALLCGVRRGGWRGVCRGQAALAYYLLTYRACIDFMSPKYTDKDAWVAIAQERFNLHPVARPRSDHGGY